MIKTMQLELLRCVPTEDGKLACCYEWREQEQLDAQQLLDSCEEETNGNVTRHR